MVLVWGDYRFSFGTLGAAFLRLIIFYYDAVLGVYHHIVVVFYSLSPIVPFFFSFFYIFILSSLFYPIGRASQQAAFIGLQGGGIHGRVGRGG